MPNHCHNRVTFYSDDTTAILKLHKIFSDESKHIELANYIFTLCYNLNANDKIIDTLGYRYYHDMDNEREGSKLRMYVGKKFYNSKVKLAYERKRTGRGIEAGTWFINHEIKF